MSDTSKGVQMGFTAESGLYSVAQGTHWLTILNQINARQKQLDTLLLVASVSEGGEGFDSLPPPRQADYLSACWSACAEIGELTKLFVETVRERGMQ